MRYFPGISVGAPLFGPHLPVGPSGPHTTAPVLSILNQAGYCLAFMSSSNPEVDYAIRAAKGIVHWAQSTLDYGAVASFYKWLDALLTVRGVKRPAILSDSANHFLAASVASPIPGPPGAGFSFSSTLSASEVAQVRAVLACLRPVANSVPPIPVPVSTPTPAPGPLGAGAVAFIWHDPNEPKDWHAMAPTGGVDLHSGKPLYRNNGLMWAPTSEVGDPTICLTHKGQDSSWGLRRSPTDEIDRYTYSCHVAPGDYFLASSNTSGVFAGTYFAVHDLPGQYTFDASGQPVYYGP